MDMDAMRVLGLKCVQEDDKVVIYAFGELDFAATPKLKEAITACICDGIVSCEIDLEHVTFIDSETFKSLLMSQKDLAEKGKRLHLRKCSPPVERAIKLLGLRDIFDIKPSN